MKRALSVFAFLLCISFACGLKCYRCTSTKSWDDCAGVQKVINCSSGENRCTKAFLDAKGEGASVKGYEKGCASAADCDAFPDSDVCKKGECKIHCCSSDLCNAAVLPVVSAIILAACGFLAYAF